MKGIIFNLLEDMIVEKWGDDVYEDILATTALQSKDPFVAPGTYPDADLMALVMAVSKRFNMTVPDVLRNFGRFCLPKLLERYPHFAAKFSHPKDFLASIDSVVHVEVNKLYSQVETPSFQYQSPDADTLIIVYKSKRKLCHFMEGLLDGVAEYFKQPFSYKQNQCLLQGADCCNFELKF